MHFVATHTCPKYLVRKDIAESHTEIIKGLCASKKAMDSSVSERRLRIRIIYENDCAGHQEISPRSR